MHGPMARIRAARAANHPTPERRRELDRELWLHPETTGARGAHGVPPAIVVRVL